MIIAIYFDDLLIYRAERKEINIKHSLKAQFHMSDLGTVSFYLGMAVTRDRANCIFRYIRGTFSLQLTYCGGPLIYKDIQTPTEREILILIGPHPVISSM